MDKDTLAIQKALLAKGFDPGKLDGEMGPKTEAAIVAFKKSLGFNPRPYFGPLTRAALFEDRPNPEGDTTEPVWIRRARQEIGVTEIAGYRHNPKILWYWMMSKLGFTDDETPWCAGFVGAMLEDCGILSTRSGMARSYSQNWGRKLDKPIKGAIVVFWRGSRSGTSGHVAFVTGVDQHGNIMCLGGNQSDQVNIKPFDTDRVIGYYWPNGVPLTGETKIDVIESDGKTSTNEA
jgi:uncharacterized protein (TIGR02594 family)